ncbi:MAG: hypothetical protein KJI72_01155 [Patescibacteria group bacterium]|nr:hypothetical protein [Patescibacteria group bacterium]
MSRSLKQFVYGIFYLAIFALILLSIYSSAFKPSPSCFDNKINQDEKGIDCDGPCISCEELNLKAPKVTGPVRVFGLSSGQTVLLAEIVNPNSTYGAIVDYRFRLYNRGGALIETIVGEEHLYPSERTYMYEPNVVVKTPDISHVELVFSKPDWVVASEMPYPSLIISEVDTVVEEDGKVRVAGIMRNRSPVIAPTVNVVAVILDNVHGAELFASQTVIARIGGFEEAPFNIFFPADTRFSEQIDEEATKVFFNVQ